MRETLFDIMPFLIQRLSDRPQLGDWDNDEVRRRLPDDRTYDHLGAYLTGSMPDATGHGSSEFKSSDNARRYLPANDRGWRPSPSPHGESLWDTTNSQPAPINILELLGWSE